jgi:hypothetical protein
MSGRRACLSARSAACASSGAVARSIVRSQRSWDGPKRPSKPSGCSPAFSSTRRAVSGIHSALLLAPPPLVPRARDMAGEGRGGCRAARQAASAWAGAGRPRSRGEGRRPRRGWSSAPRAKRHQTERENTTQRNWWKHVRIVSQAINMTSVMNSTAEPACETAARSASHEWLHPQPMTLDQSTQAPGLLDPVP